MIDFDDFSSEVFQILRAYGKDLVLYDENGSRVYEPADARRFYVIGDNLLVSITEDGDNSSVRLFLSPTMNLNQVHGFLETLRRLASQSNLLFHVKKYNKEIQPKDFATQASVNEEQEIKMNIMEGLYGTSRSSYLKMENARMIVRHSERVKEHVIGDRGRHINSIFVENAVGERFLFPVNFLAGGRAMTQHVNNGGTFADEVGQQIVRMAQDFRSLAGVTSHVKASKEMTEAMVKLQGAILESMKCIKRSLARIYTPETYIKESQKVVESAALTEGDESLAEAIDSLVGIFGDTLDEAHLQAVARRVNVVDAMSTQLAEDDVEEVADATAEVEEDVVEDKASLPAPDNSVVKEFEEWMSSFDPDSMFADKEVEEDLAPPNMDQSAPTTNGKFVVYGRMGLNSGFKKAFDSDEDRQAWIDSHMGNEKFEIIGIEDPKEEAGLTEQPVDELFMGAPEEGDLIEITAQKSMYFGKKGTVIQNPSSPEGYYVLDVDGKHIQAKASAFKLASMSEETLNEFDTDVTDLKAELHDLKAKLAKMNAFDSEYGKTKLKIDDVEAKVKKSQKYGKSGVEIDEWSVDNDDDLELLTRDDEDPPSPHNDHRANDSQMAENTMACVDGQVETSVHIGDEMDVDVVVAYTCQSSDEVTIMTITRKDNGEDVTAQIDDATKSIIADLASFDVQLAESSDDEMSDSDYLDQREKKYFNVADKQMPPRGHYASGGQEFETYVFTDPEAVERFKSENSQFDIVGTDASGQIHVGKVYHEDQTVPRDAKKDLMQDIGAHEVDQADMQRIQKLAGIRKY